MIRIALLLVLVAAVGCGSDGDTVPPFPGSDAGGGGCTVDGQCAGATPRCDKNAGVCVPCLPDNDNCRPGTHCVASNGSYACSASCRSAADCPKSDAGVAAECCNGTCLDTQGDSSNCGGCGKACPPVANGTPACAAGACVARCEARFADCNGMVGDGCEVDTAADTRHCGGCGQVCPAVANGAATCDKGACGMTCNAGFVHCSDNTADGCEVNTNSNANHCGGCGKACGMVAYAQGACLAGACAIVTCDPGFADCNKTYGDGCEAETQVDVAHCGACGNACPAQNAVASCTAGKCGIASCNAGYANCDGLPINGCEVQVASDAKNCGACARLCVVPDGVPACNNGACAIASCGAGFADCNGNVVDGCETRIGVDVGNCGGCGKVCAMVANGSPACVNATCAVGSCKFGFADCDKNVVNGCEADLLTPQTCGACNIQCGAPAHASAGCGGGMCGIGKCDPLWGDCDGNGGNGCERSLSGDASHCGACNNVCITPNAAPACGNGVCAVGACFAGFSDCDAMAQTGCEVQTAVDVKSCGACGNACPGGANGVAACSAGKCGLTCNANFADCDKNAGNGCEVTLLTDVKNCSSCGMACAAVQNGVAGCAAGKCGVGSCTMGFGDCDLNAVNGCEKNLSTDVANCGMCGKACVLANAVPSCANGACAISQCLPNFADCDGNPANGCEVNLKTDAKNCSACGMVCGGMLPFCNGGACAQCNPNVLVIGDQSPVANNQFMTALKNAGMNPTLQQDNYTYAGVPSAANFSATVVLVGNQYTNDMAAAGQTSIVNAQAAGNGLVFVEWAAYHVQNTRWTTLKNLTLILRTAGANGKAQLALTQANHPLWTGLPANFTLFNNMGLNSGANLSNGGVQIASCVECAGPGVAARDNGNGGRIVQVAFAPDYNTAPSTGDLMWANDANASKLMVNSVMWAAHCL